VNDLQYTIQAGINLVIPEAQGQIPELTEPDITEFVASAMIVAIVLTAIKLDNQARLTALKIDDVTSDRRLPAKVKSNLAQSAQSRPEPDFLARHQLS
jgi:hypothetical protein